MEANGCCTSCSTRIVAVYAAMTVSPKPFAVLCRNIIETDIMAFWSAIGMPVEIIRRHASPSVLASSRVSLKYGFLRNPTTIDPAALTPWDITVA